tara:strand:- start:143 stop:772 length:630 start_codon:yes stop_codon:yes gene_type:complete
MAIKSLKHSSLTDNAFYRSVLAGNDAYFPEFESDDFLEEVVLTTSAASVTFSGLDSYATAGYRHLQVRYMIQYINGTTGTTAMNLQLNSDTGSNYAKHYLRGYSSGGGSGVDTSSTTSSTNIQLNDAGTRPSETNNFSSGIIDLLDFSSAAKNTTIRALYGAVTPSESYIYLASGLWNSTAAVTSIKHFSVSGFSYAAGSRFSLYGSKA